MVLRQHGTPGDKLLLLLPLLLLLTPPALSSEQEDCGVALHGIDEDGDGKTALNLADIKVSMQEKIFAFSNPVIPTLAACSSGWL